jgi:hypothetical protein
VVGKCWKGPILFGFSVTELELDPTGKKRLVHILDIYGQLFFSFKMGSFTSLCQFSHPYMVPRPFRRMKSG